MSKNELTDAKAVAKQQAFRDMNPACQEYAEKISTMLENASRGQLLVRYDIGARVKFIHDHPDKFGKEALNQLAIYLDMQAHRLYALSQVAAAFTRDEILAELEAPTHSGKRLEFNHFHALSRVPEAKRTEFIKRIRENNWTTNEAEHEVRTRFERPRAPGGGRPPAKPTTPHAGLQMLHLQAQKLDRFIQERVEETVLDPLAAFDDEEKPDARTIEKLDMALNTLAQLGLDLASTVKGLEKVRDICSERMNEKSAEAGDEEPTSDASGEIGDEPFDGEADADADATPSKLARKVAKKVAKRVGGKLSQPQIAPAKKSAKKTPAAKKATKSKGGSAKRLPARV